MIKFNDMKKKIIIKNELTKRDMERIIQFLYSISEIEDIVVDMDKNSFEITTTVKEDTLKNIFTNTLNVEIME